MKLIMLQKWDPGCFCWRRCDQVSRNTLWKEFAKGVFFQLICSDKISFPYGDIHQIESRNR